MEILSILLIPMLGAAIGYSTNLLAIAMLFRPHREKRIFGLRLPFTPGLIPKERRELARKVGETFGNNVLTRQVMMEATGNSPIVDKIAAITEDNARRVLTSHKTIGAMGAEALKIDEGDLNEKAKEIAAKILEWVLDNKDLHNLAFGMAEKALVAVKTAATEKGLPYAQSSGFARLVVDFVLNTIEKGLESDKKLSEILPSGAVAAIKTAAANNMHRLASATRHFLADPRIDTRLREVVAKIVKANAGGILGIFVNPDKIYNSITENLLKYLEDEENHAHLREKLGEFIDSFTEKDTGWLKEKIKKEDLEKWVTTAVCATQRNLHKNHLDKLFNLLADKLKQLQNTDIRKTLPPTQNLAEKAAKTILSIVPGEIITNSESYAANLGTSARKLTIFLVEKAGEHIVGPLNIAGIVEEKINALEIKETESLVLSVVGKQLRWIALLGGLLGFVIGFLPVIFAI